ncbi:MAG: hypothetical protein JWM62_338 [Frankiales bacterium]|jgi:hypothetical protein|nr:hypothetical protein [Frankiales bacterium]
MSAMSQSFDDAELRAAMTSYLDLALALDEAAQVGGEARTLLDLAEAKSVAAMGLRRRLEAQGWTAPAAQRSTT